MNGFKLQQFNHDAGRYETIETRETCPAALAAYARAVGLPAWRIVSLSRGTDDAEPGAYGKPLPDTPPKAPGLSGAEQPRRGTFAPTKARARWQWKAHPPCAG